MDLIICVFSFMSRTSVHDDHRLARLHSDSPGNASRDGFLTQTIRHHNPWPDGSTSCAVVLNACVDPAPLTNIEYARNMELRC